MRSEKEQKNRHKKLAFFVKSWYISYESCCLKKGGYKIPIFDYFSHLNQPKKEYYMKNLFKLFGLIAFVAVIGFSILSLTGCDTGGGGGGGGGGSTDPLNGTWKSSDGTEVKLDKGNFEIKQNNKPDMRGTYTNAARGISAKIDMAVKERYGDALNEIDEDITFESKWYDKEDVIDVYKEETKNKYPFLDDDEISEFLADMSDDLDEMFPTKKAEIDGDTMTLDGKIFTKDGGSTPVNPGISAMTWTTVDVSDIFKRASSDGDTRVTQINAIAYGNGKFVASGGSGTMAYSSDGKNWTPITTDAFDFYNLSQDTEVTKPDIKAITFGNGKFVAVSDYNTGSGRILATSTDGVTWTAVKTAGDDIGIGSWWGFYCNNSIAFGNNTFVAGGPAKLENANFATSPDGVKWTLVETDAFNYTALYLTQSVPINGIAYGGGVFVAVGSGANDRGKVAYSSDNGATWTPVTTAIFDEKTIDAIAYGNNKFVAGGRYGFISYSSDGINWTDIKDPVIYTTNSSGRTVTVGINAIAYGNGIFVIGGDSGAAAASTDGITWTSAGDGILGINSINYKAEINAIAFGGGVFVAGGGTSGKIAYSTGGGTDIGAAPKITTTTLPDGTVTKAYSQTLAATGDKPITWSIASGTLPAGLSLAGTGVISGTPTGAGTFNFTVRAANAKGDNTKSLTITIGTGGGGSGDNLTLSGQVYTMGVNENPGTGNMITYTPYTGPDKTLTSSIGGTGSITNGQMSFSIGIPSDVTSMDTILNGGKGSLWANDAAVQPSATLGWMGLSFDDENNRSIEFSRQNYVIIASSSSYSSTVENIFYFYVDRDCTITSKGSTEGTGSTKKTFSSMNLSLKKGWNTLNFTTAATTTGQTITLKTGDLSSCKWVLRGN